MQVQAAGGYQPNSSAEETADDIEVRAAADQVSGREQQPGRGGADVEQDRDQHLEQAPRGQRFLGHSLSPGRTQARRVVGFRKNQVWLSGESGLDTPDGYASLNAAFAWAADAVQWVIVGSRLADEDCAEGY